MKEIRGLFNHDRISEELFDIRYNYYMSGNSFELRNLWKYCSLPDEVTSVLEINDLINYERIEKCRIAIADKLMKKSKNSKVLIYGCGRNARNLLNYIKKSENIIFVDKRAKEMNNIFYDYLVVEPEKLISEYKSGDVYLTVSQNYFLIEAFFINEGIINRLVPIPCFDPDCCKIPMAICINEDEQYFEQGIIKPEKNEVFVDAGFFTGETSRRFAQWCGMHYDKIYAFEPDDDNIEKYMISDNKIERLEMVKAAAWNSDTELCFEKGREKKHGQGSASCVSDCGSVKVKARSIDSVLDGERCTFIKMDIEGSELNALRGAEKTIKKYHPKLAICIYHKPEDIVEIPQYIHSICSEYKMYIRHYSNCGAETVLYAVYE